MSARSYVLLSVAALALYAAYNGAQAEVYYTPNVMKDAITPMTPLARGATVQLAGTTDGDEEFSVVLETDEAGALLRMTAAQDGEKLGLPDSAFADLSGADTAWLEERGALSTLVVEGWTTEGKRWRLALEFHPKQLWKRRFSMEGERRDLFTFYSRKDMTPSQPERRRAGNEGLYWRD